MTYWPISSPSVFAATKHTNAEHAVVSHDGVEHKEAEDETLAHDTTGPAKSSGPQGAEDDIHGEILAIRATRSGHMFATLTRSTLTVWQTKAWLCSHAHWPSADHWRSPLLSWPLFYVPSNRYAHMAQIQISFSAQIPRSSSCRPPSASSSPTLSQQTIRRASTRPNSQILMAAIRANRVQ